MQKTWVLLATSILLEPGSALAADDYSQLVVLLNEFTVEDAVGFIAENVPFNSEEGYRIDAELYDMLRRTTHAINTYHELS